MKLERGGVAEGARADLAGVGALPCVHAHVHSQLASLVKP